jgi:hypothetical protein
LAVFQKCPYFDGDNHDDDDRVFALCAPPSCFCCYTLSVFIPQNILPKESKTHNRKGIVLSGACIDNVDSGQKYPQGRTAIIGVFSSPSIMDTSYPGY